MIARASDIGLGIAILTAAIAASCGGAGVDAGGGPSDRGARGDGSEGGVEALTSLSREQIERGYPCDLPARGIDAVPLGGPHPSVERFCAGAGISGCEAVGPSVEFPSPEAVFSKAMVIAGARGDGPVAFVAIERGGSWFASEPIGAPGETAGHPGPVSTEGGEDFPDRVVLNIELEGTSADGIEGRSVTLLCSTGRSAVPACVSLPESWRLSGGEDVVRLLTLPCDDGTIVIYGNPSRLPEPVQAGAREHLGRRRPVFP